jgi:hypothetical protein
MNTISSMASRLTDQLFERRMKALISSIIMFAVVGSAHANSKSDDCTPKGKRTPTLTGTVEPGKRWLLGGTSFLQHPR